MKRVATIALGASLALSAPGVAETMHEAAGVESVSANDLNQVSRLGYPELFKTEDLAPFLELYGVEPEVDFMSIAEAAVANYNGTDGIYSVPLSGIMQSTDYSEMQIVRAIIAYMDSYIGFSDDDRAKILNVLSNPSNVTFNNCGEVIACFSAPDKLMLADDLRLTIHESGHIPDEFLYDINHKTEVNYVLDENGVYVMTELSEGQNPAAKVVTGYREDPELKYKLVSTVSFYDQTGEVVAMYNIFHMQEIIPVLLDGQLMKTLGVETVNANYFNHLVPNDTEIWRHISKLYGIDASSLDNAIQIREYYREIWKAYNSGDILTIVSILGWMDRIYVRGQGVAPIQDFPFYENYADDMADLNLVYGFTLINTLSNSIDNAFRGRN